MVSAFAFALVLGAGSIDCSQVPELGSASWREFIGDKRVRSQSAHSAVLNICSDFSKNYESAEIKIVTVVEKSVHSYDEYKRSQLIAGRVRIHWTEKQASLCPCVASVAWLNIKLYKNTWLASRSLKPGSIIRSRDVSRGQANVAPFIGGKPIFEGRPIGMYLKKGVRKGSIFTTEQLRNPPIILRQDIVDVTAGDVGVTLTFKAKALNEGWGVGEEMKVQSLDNGKVFVGKVKSSGQVYVEI